MKSKVKSTFQWDVFLIWMLVFVFCFVFWKGMFSLSFAADWLPKTKWSLLYTNSENTNQYDERAIYAFDGDINTHWMSRWSPSPSDPHPHEVQIDLGATYLIDGFSYLPRQSTGANGQVKGYQFYISDDKTNFGLPVVSGNLAPGITESVVEFPAPKTGRYISFVVTSEQKTPSQYSNAAEIGVRAVKEDDIKEFPYGSDLKITFDPSPDERATGHNFYITNTVSSESTKIDLKDEVVHLIANGILTQGVGYKLTATAYGMVNNELKESVHSDPLYVRMTEALIDLPVTRPSSPRIIDIRW